MLLEHVNLTVADPERSAAFYADLLDLHIRWKGRGDEGRLAVHVGNDTQYLALFEAVRPGAVDHDYGNPGINHFGFVVDDLDETKRRLDALGIVHRTPDITYDPGRRLYFNDFDDVEVELVEYSST